METKNTRQGQYEMADKGGKGSNEEAPASNKNPESTAMTSKNAAGGGSPEKKKAGIANGAPINSAVAPVDTTPAPASGEEEEPHWHTPFFFANWLQKYPKTMFCE